MATDKKHIAVYLDKENQTALEEYIERHGGIKYSAAVNQILAAFFGNSPSAIPGNIPTPDDIEATVKKLFEEYLSKIPSNTLSNIPIDEILERLSSLERKLEDLSNIPEAIPDNILNQSVVETEQILSNIPGIAPDEVTAISVEVEPAIASIPQTSESA
ncbi:MAG: hypothetical protein WBB28_10780 [Crinalium sp.]